MRVAVLASRVLGCCACLVGVAGLSTVQGRCLRWPIAMPQQEIVGGVLRQGHHENGMAGTPGSAFQTPSPSQGSGGSGAGAVGGPPPINRGAPGASRGASGMHGQPVAPWRRCSHRPLKTER